MSEFDPYHRWLGIPPEEQPPHHYRLLGIRLFEDQPEVIEHAADRQMAHLRTFQVGPHAALSQKLLNEVTAARHCLLKPEKKAAYDQFLRERLGGAKRPAAPSGEPPPFPVAPPGEEAPVVELDSPEEDRPRPYLRRGWKAAALGVAAAGLVVGIGVLVAMLGSPSLPVAENPADVDRPPDAAASLPPDAPAPMSLDRPTPSTPAPAAEEHASEDEAEEDEAAFWASLMEGAWEVAGASQGGAPAAEPPKPPEKPSPSPDAAKSEPKPAPGPTQAAATPKPEPIVPPPAKRPEWKPEPFKTVAQVDPMLAEAWTLIRRGDHVKGRDKLVQAGKSHREDLRVPFSLGLVDALVTLDWAAAEKEFLQCLQEHPKHAATLNNLALVRLRLGREAQAVKHWQAALAEGPPSDEIVQNLGRVRMLAQKNRIVLKPATLKAINSLFVDAQLAGEGRFDEKAGFRYMGLFGGGDPHFGWTERHDYEDCWCPVCNARGTIKCPQRDCDRGMVTRMASKVVGFHPVTKAPIRQESPIRVPCTVCNQAGVIPCPHCTNGKDKQLK